MIVVVDVSAVMEILFQKDKKDLLSGWISEASWVIAPDLYVSELSNVLWKYYTARAITSADCIQYVEDGLHMIDDFIDGRELWKEALGEGIKHKHSIYDMYYLVLARRNNAVLATIDGALSRICKKLKIGLCH